MAKRNIIVLQVDDQPLILQTTQMQVKTFMAPRHHDDVEFTYQGFHNHEELNEWLAANRDKHKDCFIISDNSTGASLQTQDGEGLDWLAARTPEQKPIPAILYTSDGAKAAEKAAVLGIPFVEKAEQKRAVALLEKIEHAFGLPSKSQQPAPQAAGASAQGRG